MILGISQPTFMPWAGYFAFMDKIDKLVFLDDVQFEKRSWQQRNKILLNNREHLLTISVKSKGKFKQKISEVEISDDKNIQLIKKKIYYAYNKSPYFLNYYENICNILESKLNYLSKINIELIKFFTKELNIKINFDYSSNYSLNLNKEKLIFKICKLNKCDQYLTTIGSENYLKGYSVIPNTNIKISYFKYDDIKYLQLNDDFIPKLSILDLLFNEGENSLKILQKSFKLI
tara:strand:- start:271 stop:966 length:696 start_codon:yes stop_codon:yes gene_type:complete